MPVLGVDISHYQNRPDIGKLKAGGVQFVGIKAWEGSSADKDFSTNRQNCIAHSMPYWAYVYLHASDNSDKMKACFDCVGGSVLALDWEDGNTPASTVETWMDAYEDRLNYYGLYPPFTATPRIGTWPRWFPRYNTSPGLAAWNGEPAPDWRNYYLIWQNSDKGTFPGLSGNFDTNQLAPAVTIEQFTNWLKQGSLPSPTPIPPEAGPPTLRKGDSGPDVVTLQTDLTVPWLVCDGSFGAVTDNIVRGFQGTKGLTVDGVVGPATWAALATLEP